VALEPKQMAVRVLRHYERSQEFADEDAVVTVAEAAGGLQEGGAAAHSRGAQLIVSPTGVQGGGAAADSEFTVGAC
jgi:hypothetical protein